MSGENKRFPVQWREVTIGDHVRFLRRGTHSRAVQGTDGPVINVHYGDVHAATRPYLDCNELAELPTLTHEQAAGLDPLLDGDLVIADASEDLDGVGKAVELAGLGGNIAVAGTHTIAARLDKAVFADGFKGLLQHIPEFSTQIRRLAAGTKVYGITRSHIGSVSLHLPPVHEQEAIGRTLGDADKLLQELTRLLAKKRDIYRGVMQQLLSGDTRLPGFTDAWKECCLGNHVSFLRNGANPRADLDAASPVRYLHYGDIHAAEFGTLDVARAEMPRLPAEKALGIERLQNGDVVFVDASEDLDGIGRSVEVVGLEGCELIAGLHTIAARFDRTVLTDGFKGYLQHCPPFRRQLTRLAQGTKVFATSRQHIQTVVLRLPSLTEQEAIAGILLECESELAALHRRIRTTADLRIAVMQELLSGRTRLVNKGGSNA